MFQLKYIDVAVIVILIITSGNEHYKGYTHRCFSIADLQFKKQNQSRL